MIIKKGQVHQGMAGEVTHFCVGSTTNTFGKTDIRMFIKAVDLKVGESGALEEMDGSKLDIRKYTVKVSKAAFASYLKHFEFSQEATEE